MKITDEMIDKAMPDKSDTYPDCPLCEYSGKWNHNMDEQSQREAIRALLEKALSTM